MVGLAVASELRKKSRNESLMAAELKEKLKDRNLPTTGLKVELIKRLGSGSPIGRVVFIFKWNLDDYGVQRIEIQKDLLKTDKNGNKRIGQKARF